MSAHFPSIEASISRNKPKILNLLLNKLQICSFRFFVSFIIALSPCLSFHVLQNAIVASSLLENYQNQREHYKQHGRYLGPALELSFKASGLVFAEKRFSTPCNGSRQTGFPARLEQNNRYQKDFGQHQQSGKDILYNCQQNSPFLQMTTLL